MATDTRIDSILFGCALAVWHNPVIDAPAVRDSTLKYRLLPVALLTLGACVAIRSGAFRETLRYSLQGAALTLVFVSAIRFQKWGAFRLLNWRPVMFIGALSYSLYLIHQTVLIKVQELTYPHPLPQAVLSLLIAMAIAWGIYQLI